MWSRMIGSLFAGVLYAGRKAIPATFKAGVAALIAAMLWLSDGLWDLLQAVYEELPEEMTANVEPFLPYLQVANLLAPLKEMVLMLAALTAGWVLFVSVRTLVRSIPTMG